MPKESDMKTNTPNLLELIKTPLRQTKKAIKTLPYYGKARYCPVCDKSSSRFIPFGIVLREDARCIHCNALERHRFLALFLQQQTDLFNGKSHKMLHVAPEGCFESMFKKHLGSNYLTADLLNPHAMLKMDICDIQFPDQSFDVIYCSHVFEHVLDDHKAMREFYRVLKNDGWAILNVPISREKTFEDSSIVDPQERLKAFGQEDHVRVYGLDYVERLRDAGFNVEVIKVNDLTDSETATRMGLTPASGQIYYCTK